MIYLILGFLVVNIVSITIAWEPKIYKLKNFLILEYSTNKKHRAHRRRIILKTYKNYGK